MEISISGPKDFYLSIYQMCIRDRCKRTRTHADNFRGIPVRHDAINGTFTMKVRLDALPGFDLLIKDVYKRQASDSAYSH